MADKPRPEVGKEKEKLRLAKEMERELWLVSPLNLKWIISSPLAGPLDNLTLLIREVEQFLARLPVGILGGRENEICLLAQAFFQVVPPTSFSCNTRKSPLQLRQVLSGSSRYVLCDEFKKSCKRDFTILHIPLKW